MNREPIRPETFGQLFWSIAAGAALTCAFPGVAVPWCAWFALAALLAGLRQATVRRAFMLGLLAGFVHFLTLLYWLVPTMHRYGPMPLVLAMGALLLLAFYLALYVSVFSGLITACARSKMAHPLWCLLMVPVLWTGLEYLRAHLFSGFPWGLLGYSQYNALHVIQIADIGGVYAVSGLAALVNGAVLIGGLAALRRSWQGRVPSVPAALFCVVAACAVFAAVWGYGGWRLQQVERAASAAESMRVGVVQGNIGQSLKWDDTFRERTTRKYIRLSQSLLSRDSEPDLVVWPETALPFYFFYDKELTREVLDAVARAGVHFLIGSPACEYDQAAGALTLYNSAYLIDPAGQVSGRYDKVHLVPFGEYVPFGDWLPFLGKMVPQAADFSAGQAGQVLEVNGTRLGVQICYEMIFPALSTEMVRRGADVLINITNDAWFGKTAAPMQHFAMAVLRTVENRRALVRAANTGISGFVSPAGRIRQVTEIFETAAVARGVPVMRSMQTVYTRRGDLFARVVLGLGLVILAVGLRKGSLIRR